MIVVDASVIATALVDDGVDGRFPRERIRRERLTAPEVLDLEVVSVTRRLGAAGMITPGCSEQAVAGLRDLDLDRAPHLPLLVRCGERRHNLWTFDASYLALAGALGAVLLAADARLATAPGTSCIMELIEPPSR